MITHEFVEPEEFLYCPFFVYFARNTILSTKNFLLGKRDSAVGTCGLLVTIRLCSPIKLTKATEFMLSLRKFFYGLSFFHETLCIWFKNRKTITSIEM